MTGFERHLATDRYLPQDYPDKDDRRLFLGEGCSSLFTYCTQALRLSEHAAYGRIAAARASRRFPLVLRLFSAGDLTLTAITMLGPYLTLENHEALLREAVGKSKRDVALILARLNPRPAIAASVTPLAPGMFKLQCSIGQQAHDDLRTAQDLLRHVIPTGDIGLIIERALCAFVGPRGRCRETGALEYHHVVPYAAGGPTTAENLELRCRAHNSYEAEVYFGPGEESAGG